MRLGDGDNGCAPGYSPRCAVVIIAPEVESGLARPLVFGSEENKQATPQGVLSVWH